MGPQTLAGPDLDAVRSLFADPEKRRRMAQAYRQRAEEDREVAEATLPAAVEVLPEE